MAQISLPGTASLCSDNVDKISENADSFFGLSVETRLRQMNTDDVSLLHSTNQSEVDIACARNKLKRKFVSDSTDVEVRQFSWTHNQCNLSQPQAMVPLTPPPLDGCEQTLLLHECSQQSPKWRTSYIDLMSQVDKFHERSAEDTKHLQPLEAVKCFSEVCESALVSQRELEDLHSPSSAKRSSDTHTSESNTVAQLKPFRPRPNAGIDNARTNFENEFSADIGDDTVCVEEGDGIEGRMCPMVESGMMASRNVVPKIVTVSESILANHIISVNEEEEKEEAFEEFSCMSFLHSANRISDHDHGDVIELEDSLRDVILSYENAISDMRSEKLTESPTADVNGHGNAHRQQFPFPTNIPFDLLRMMGFSSLWRMLETKYCWRKLIGGGLSDSSRCFFVKPGTALTVEDILLAESEAVEFKEHDYFSTRLGVLQYIEAELHEIELARIQARVCAADQRSALGTSL